MKHLCAILSLVGLAACGGNPFVDGGGGGGGVPPDPTDVVVPAALKFDVQSVKYTPGATRATDTLEIQITGLDTTPLVATWARLDGSVSGRTLGAHSVKGREQSIVVYAVDGKS